MEKLIALLSSVNEDVDWQNSADLMDSGALDSFDIISIVANLSDEYGVEIGAEELLPENFNSASAILAMIERLLQLR
ncbi:MAG: acyl carrier protein [Clostridiales bacterium]|jgi:acyl carrier protein|nr:acyl carrier protein [Clostridiales bacterium]MDR2751061.1 acyl carrier protein [Clostridiales bacterium]